KAISRPPASHTATLILMFISRALSMAAFTIRFASSRVRAMSCPPLVSSPRNEWNKLYRLRVLSSERRTRMRTGRPIPPLTITDEERETLERWARRPTTAQAVAQRARLILSCAGGRTNTPVAHDLHLTKQTVGKWRTRFLAQRLD